MKTISFFMCFSLLLFAQSASAEVFKCKVDGKIVYQHQQCATDQATQGLLKESSPRQIEKDRQNMQAWQSQVAEVEAAKQAEEKQRQDDLAKRQEELAKQESLDLQRRSVEAQERQAAAAQQQPKNVYIPAAPYGPQYWNGGMPPYPNNGQFHHHHDHDHDASQQDMQPQDPMQPGYPQPMMPPPYPQVPPKPKYEVHNNSL